MQERYNSQRALLVERRLIHSTHAPAATYMIDVHVITDATLCIYSLSLSTK